MRIISGKYRGRGLKGYQMEGTRPTMDRVKESLFAMIQRRVKDSVCLDLFSGSGALGLEALSNGARKVYFVDYSEQAIRTLRENIESLQVTEDYEIFQGDYKKVLSQLVEKGITFDIIFLDPPYHRHYINRILEIVCDNSLLSENGQVVCEYEDEIVHCDRLTLIKERKYGGKYVRIYQKGGES